MNLLLRLLLSSVLVLSFSFVSPVNAEEESWDDDSFIEEDYDIEDYDDEDAEDLWYEDEDEYYSDIISEDWDDYEEFIDEDEIDDYLDDLDIEVTDDDFDDFDDIEEIEDVAWELWYDDADDLIADLELEEEFPEPESYDDIFGDIENDEYRDAITFVEDMWIVDWYDDGSYKPKNNINRAELLKIIMESNYPWFEPSDKNCFPDVPWDQWFAKYVCWALEKWIIKWYWDWTFRPSKKVSSAESIKMILKAKGENI